MIITRPVSAAIASHAAKNTGTHGVGAFYIAMAAASQYVAVNRESDYSLGAAFLRAVNNDYLNIWGGQIPAGGIKLYGKDAPGTPGEIHGYVPNAAKTAAIYAFRFSGNTDTPEMTAGTIPVGRLKRSTGNYSYDLPSENAFFEGYFTCHQYSFLPLFRATGGIDPKGAVYWDLACVEPTLSADVTYHVEHTTGGGITTFQCSWDYLSSSGQPEIWIGLDEDGKVRALWRAEDPPPVRPPLWSPSIVSLIRINPALESYRLLGDFSLADIRRTRESLYIKETPFDYKAHPKSQVPRERFFRREISKHIPVKVLKTELVKVLNEWTGEFEDRLQPVTVPTEKLHYYLDKDGQVQSEILTLPEPVMEDSFVEEKELVEEWVPL